MLFFIFFCFMGDIVVAHDNRVQSYKINARKLSSRIVFLSRSLKMGMPERNKSRRGGFYVGCKCVWAGAESRSGNNPVGYKNAATGEAGSARCGIVEGFINVARDGLEIHLLANILRNGILVDHEVHRVGCYEGLGHVPNALVVARLAP